MSLPPPSFLQALPCDKPPRGMSLFPRACATGEKQVVTKYPTSAFMKMIIENIFCFLWDFVVSEKEDKELVCLDSTALPFPSSQMCSHVCAPSFSQPRVGWSHEAGWLP